MGKKLHYIIIALLLVVVLITPAALCNQCSTIIGGMDTGESETLQLEETNNRENYGQNQDNSQDSNGSSGNEELVAPSVTLSISEGPLYTEDGQLCYYRIKAAVSGNPKPQIHWSKDESNGAYGRDIAQVNLQKGQSYTLICTAENAAGSKTDSIVLTWTEDGQNIVVDNDNENDNNDNSQDEQGEDQQQEDQQQEDEEEDDQGLPEDFNPMEHTITSTVTLYPVSSETGSVAQDRSAVDTQYIWLGMPEGKVDYRGYISFDLTSHQNKLVKSVKFYVKNTAGGSEFSEHGEIRVGVIDYGAGPLDTRVVNMPSTKIAGFANNNNDLIIQDGKLLELLRDSIFHEDRFQLTIYCEYEGVYPGIIHYKRYSASGLGNYLEIVFF